MRFRALREAARVLWLVGAAARRLARLDPAGARHALGLVSGRGPGGRSMPVPVSAAEAALVIDAVEAALLSSEMSLGAVGSRAQSLRRRLDEAGWDGAWNADPAAADAVVAAGLVEELPAGRVASELATLAADGPAVLLLPTWPVGRHAALDATSLRLLRSRDWWSDRVAEAALEPIVQVRRSAAGYDCLVLRDRPAPARERPRPTDAGGGHAPVVRINDDLSAANSFAWISASIALALEDTGGRVSIAPTAISTSFGDLRRARLAALVEGEDGGSPPADSEVGWTHFWPQYRRPLGGRLPLALFAINYQFGRRDLAGFDPWMRELIGSSMPIAPISSFCRDVLVDAGVAPDRTAIVPMAVTDGIEGVEPGRIPRARALKLLHVTNAADLDRNGTPLALAAYRAAFEPADDVTLVVRDYGSYSAAVDAEVAALAQRGYDVRYWPMFFAEDRLGAFLGAFDALLAPFRGEGFGIKLLDAMACATPPVCPFYGGPRDFVDDSVAVALDYDLVPVSAGYDQAQIALGNEPRWAECRHGSLVEVLRGLLDDPAGLARRGTAARERALSRFTWRHTAERIGELVEAHRG